MKKTTYKTATNLVLQGRNSEKYGGLVNPPTFRGSTVIFKDLDEFYNVSSDKSRHNKKSYSTRGTPSSDLLADVMLTLEGVENGQVVFQPSGLASITILLAGLHKHGDHILIPEAVYWPCKDFCNSTLASYGIEVELYTPRITPEELAKKIKKNTKTLYLESPISTSFEIQDIPALVKLAKQHGLTTILDNTWSGGYFFKAFDHDVDFVLYAMTKHQLGLSVGLMGAILCKDKNKSKLEYVQNIFGVCCGSHEIEQALLGMRTLETRMLRLQESSMKVALWLQKQEIVQNIYYPALPESPDHTLWKRDYTGASSPFTFSLAKSDENATARLYESIKLFCLGYSWAGYESLMIPLKSDYFNNSYPKHAKNIDDNYFRIYIGMEDTDDLIEDLQNGFSKYRNK